MNLSHKETVDVSVEQCIENTYQMNETFTKERTEKVKHPLMRFQDWLLLDFFKVHQLYFISLKFTKKGHQKRQDAYLLFGKWTRRPDAVLWSELEEFGSDATNKSSSLLLDSSSVASSKESPNSTSISSSSSADNAESEDVTSDSLEYAASSLGGWFSKALHPGILLTPPKICRDISGIFSSSEAVSYIWYDGSRCIF